GAYRHWGTRQDVELPRQHVWRAGGPEVAYVDAFGAADPHPAGERLMDVAEQHKAGLESLDLREQGGAPPLQPPGDRVVQEFRPVGRGMPAQAGGHSARRPL